MFPSQQLRHVFTISLSSVSKSEVTYIEKLNFKILKQAFRLVGKKLLNLYECIKSFYGRMILNTYVRYFSFALNTL